MITNRDRFPILAISAERGTYQRDPPYQRESAAWSLDQRQLLINSILNDYDIPKIYLHDLRKGFTSGLSPHKYAVIDGKQRLSSIWDFIDDKYPVEDRFEFSAGRTPSARQPDISSLKFSQLDEEWRTVFLAKSIDVVLVETDDIEDIEDLFMRLNNGEPLNAAEKRNAMGGRMCELIRDLARHRFFTGRLPFANKRYSHYEAAAKVLLIEDSSLKTKATFVDLKKRYLDTLVRTSKVVDPKHEKELMDSAKSQLDQVCLIFGEKDPLLGKQAYIPMYYLFNRHMKASYRGKALNAKMKTFIRGFQIQRMADLGKPEDERDPYLREFGRLVQQGTNDKLSLERRVRILTQYMLARFPEVLYPIDDKRSFDGEERAAIWIRADGKCQSCGAELALSDMHADHETRWVDGGQTTLKNARCLCVTCNTAEAKKVES